MGRLRLKAFFIPKVWFRGDIGLRARRYTRAVLYTFNLHTLTPLTAQAKVPLPSRRAALPQGGPIHLQPAHARAARARVPLGAPLGPTQLCVQHGLLTLRPGVHLPAGVCHPIGVRPPRARAEPDGAVQGVGGGPLLHAPGLGAGHRLPQQHGQQLCALRARLPPAPRRRVPRGARVPHVALSLRVLRGGALRRGAAAGGHLLRRAGGRVDRQREPDLVRRDRGGAAPQGRGRRGAEALLRGVQPPVGAERAADGKVRLLQGRRGRHEPHQPVPALHDRVRGGAAHAARLPHTHHDALRERRAGPRLQRVPRALLCALLLGVALGRGALRCRLHGGVHLRRHRHAAVQHCGGSGAAVRCRGARRRVVDDGGGGGGAHRGRDVPAGHGRDDGHAAAILRRRPLRHARRRRAAAVARRARRRGHQLRGRRVAYAGFEGGLS
ncbi:MAG: hypothetical protein J3K34DRAFT_436119 [Monoraphidium minutum]|nr:MAG: hypothetical protein J3K34DRAFT_436119 [Monoraphidium minutum]